MTRHGPDWLAELQERFGSMLRTPLDRSSGTLTARPETYDAALAADTHGELAVYNRQYWFRLFDLFSTAFPLTMRLFGAWTFNDFSARFLLASPPRDWDLERATEGFTEFLQVDLASHQERELLLEAAHLDAAWLTVLRAPAVAAYRPTGSDAARLLDARLVPSRSVVLLTEHAALSELRKQLLESRGEARVAMPARFASARFSALVREAAGTAQLPLEPREAELLTLLGTYSVREALARLELACDADERATLPARAQTWLAQSVHRNFWSGVRF